MKSYRHHKENLIPGAFYVINEGVMECKDIIKLRKSQAEEHVNVIMEVGTHL